MAAPWSIETLGEAILNLSGQIDLPITLETSHYLFNIDMIGLYIYIQWICLVHQGGIHKPVEHDKSLLR